MDVTGNQHSNVDPGLSPWDLMGKSQFGVRIILFSRLSYLDIRGRLFLVMSLRGGRSIASGGWDHSVPLFGSEEWLEYVKVEQVEVKMEIDPV